MLQWLLERWRPRAAAPADVRLRIESNRLHLRDLEKRMEHLNKRALAERNQAKALHQSSSRMSALFHLRRAKMYESQEQALQGQMLNLDEATTRLEQSALTAETFTGLKQGAVALQQAGAGRSVEGHRVFSKEKGPSLTQGAFHGFPDWG